MRILDHLNVIRSERGVDLPVNQQWSDVTRAQPIDFEGAVRQLGEWTVETNEDRSHAVARQCACAIRDRNRNLRWQHYGRPAEELGRCRAILIGASGAEVEAAFAGLKKRRIRREQ